MRNAEGRSLRSDARTVGMLALLASVLPLNLAVTGLALLRGLATPPGRAVAAEPRTVLISGGKMTKALALARSFHAAGHRVVLVESARYRFTGHRFSRAVARFHVVPLPQDPGYADALVEIVRSEGVDVYVPVCSPASAFYDAQAKKALEEYCEVLHVDPETLVKLDDKAEFAATAASLGLRVPESHRITRPGQVNEIVDGRDTTFVLKSIPYDPVRRLDLTPLPRPTPQQTRAFADALPISDDHPWVLQEFVAGQEYCTHSTVRGGRVQVHACCESSAFQINYAMVDDPEIEAWVTSFVGALGITGQASFDFIRSDDGTVQAIECNPRTHSAITMFYDHPEVAHAYLADLPDDRPAVVPTATSRPTYWIYHEIWRLLTQPARRHRLGVIACGKDAIFDWSDPLPFLLVHHLQIPSLLVDNLRRGAGWLRIDMNIGKLVEPAGD